MSCVSLAISSAQACDAGDRTSSRYGRPAIRIPSRRSRAYNPAVGGQMFTTRVFAGCAIAMLAASGVAQEHEHGKGEKLGAVHFATSCDAEAQKEFDRAVALLHSFQFNYAIQGFNAALKSDPTCGIAYWGIALSQWSNPFAAGMKDNGQLQAGRDSAERGKAAGAKTERERAYIVAVASLYSNFESTSQQARLLDYRDAMEVLASKYSDDQEAQIFYALALAAAEEPTDKTYAARLKAGAILEKLFREEPNHPGLAHYIIHTYDVPSLAGKALIAARRYSDIAPDAPHALHMPSHTFTRVGYWQNSIDSNRAAAAASRREGQTAAELHASDYQVYAYLQTAQDEAARKVLEALPEIASRFDPRGGERRSGSRRRILRAGSDSRALCCGASRLAAGDGAAATRDAVSLHRCHNLVCARHSSGPAA